MVFSSKPEPADPYLWLEEVESVKALDWVRQQNKASIELLEARPEYAPLRSQVLDILNSKERIPEIQRVGSWFYNLWKDEEHPRGLWRRTTLDEYRSTSPKWETVLDLDALAKTEDTNWVWAGVQWLGPAYERCVLELSKGGADAVVVREFDAITKAFVTDGFELPEAKSSVEWLNADTLLVGTDSGPGSLTTSGYPRRIQRWKRGTPISEAPVVFEAKPEDVSAGVSVERGPGRVRTVFTRAVDFYNEEVFIQTGETLVRLPKPADASVRFQGEWLFLRLRSEWIHRGRTFPSGSLLSTKLDEFLADQGELTPLFEPTEGRSLASFDLTRSFVLLEILENVAGRIEELQWSEGRWQKRSVQAPFPGTLTIQSLYDPALESDPLAEQYLLQYEDFLTPESLWLATTGGDARELLKRRPEFFDSTGIRVEQHFAASKDSTRVPYFVVWPKDAQADAGNPTLLYGYGGFEVSVRPFYAGSYGPAWYNKGGVFVVANIRGGDEFGPGWHQAATKRLKQHSYDDFIAVAEDLIRTKVTSAAHLGIMGGSNGGLLVGAVAVQRPDLFNAVVCQVPLLDMQRYHKLLAGASWMAEYGDPEDAEDWAAIRQYSPYQNLRPDGKYPRMFFNTSTRDDRVHPGHARKMVARMNEQGHPVLYFENVEGGHGGAADNTQRARLIALEFSYLWMQLGLSPNP
jgi:prolyl oligopeptidase